MQAYIHEIRLLFKAERPSSWMTCLVSDGNASLDVYEAIGVPAIDPVNDVILFNPLGINLPQPFLVLGVSLKTCQSKGRQSPAFIP